MTNPTRQYAQSKVLWGYKNLITGETSSHLNQYLLLRKQNVNGLVTKL